jgi:hypothetical protein
MVRSLIAEELKSNINADTLPVSGRAGVGTTS